jgi:hypothetical protein
MSDLCHASAFQQARYQPSSRSTCRSWPVRSGKCRLPIARRFPSFFATSRHLRQRIHRYPDSLGYEAEFKAIVQAWRPELGG